VSTRRHRGTQSAPLAIILSIGVLYAGYVLAAVAGADPKAAKIAELAQLQGLDRVLEQARAAGRDAATQVVRSRTDPLFAQSPGMPAPKRAAIEAASQQFLSEVDRGFDQENAVRLWGEFYSAALTEKELDAVLAYYRSPLGQKDVRASQAALSQLQRYLLEKRTLAMSSAVARYTEALREVESLPTSNPAQSAGATRRSLGTNPSAPDGKVVEDSVSDRCDVTASAASAGHEGSPSGRSVLCVCVDEKGVLTQDPVIAESSGDPKLDSGAVKVARLGSGRYQPPSRQGKPQKACFRFAINFRRKE
jgi:hypothetical protein